MYLGTSTSVRTICGRPSPANTKLTRIRCDFKTRLRKCTEHRINETKTY